MRRGAILLNKNNTVIAVRVLTDTKRHRPRTRSYLKFNLVSFAANCGVREAAEELCFRLHGAVFQKIQNKRQIMRKRKIYKFKHLDKYFKEYDDDRCRHLRFSEYIKPSSDWSDQQWFSECTQHLFMYRRCHWNCFLSINW